MTHKRGGEAGCEISAIGVPNPSNAVQAAIERTLAVPLTKEQALIAPEIITFLGIRPQTQLTPYVVATWCRVLSVFPLATVQRAVLECSLSLEEKVGLPQIVNKCRTVEADKAYSPGADTKKLPSSLVDKIFRAIHIDK